MIEDHVLWFWTTSDDELGPSALLSEQLSVQSKLALIKNMPMIVRSIDPERCPLCQAHWTKQSTSAPPANESTVESGMQNGHSTLRDFKRIASIVISAS